jgi:hypothetical protein
MGNEHACNAWTCHGYTPTVTDNCNVPSTLPELLPSKIFSAAEGVNGLAPVNRITLSDHWAQRATYPTEAEQCPAEGLFPTDAPTSRRCDIGRRKHRAGELYPIRNQRHRRLFLPKQIVVTLDAHGKIRIKTPAMSMLVIVAREPAREPAPPLSCRELAAVCMERRFVGGRELPDSVSPLSGRHCVCIRARVSSASSNQSKTCYCSHECILPLAITHYWRVQALKLSCGP